MRLDTPTFIQAVRDYIQLEGDSTSRYSNSTIGSNARAAMNFLERRTNRFLWDRTQTLTLSSEGKPYLGIPGLRVASSVSKGGATVEADSGYYLIPDPLFTGLYTGVQLRPYRRGPDDDRWYLGNSEWFDRNLDSGYWRSHDYSNQPNDVVIDGSWGFADGSEPEEMLHAGKVLTAYFTKRPDAILSGTLVTEEGNEFDLSEYPVEVRSFIHDWRLRQMATSVG